jgi:hypothetical protein
VRAIASALTIPEFSGHHGKLTKRHHAMDALPLQEQLRNEQWRRMIKGARPADLENLRTMALKILEYAETNRRLTLVQARMMLPQQQNAPAAEATRAPAS